MYQVPGTPVNDKNVHLLSGLSHVSQRKRVLWWVRYTDTWYIPIRCSPLPTQNVFSHMQKRASYQKNVSSSWGFHKPVKAVQFRVWYTAYVQQGAKLPCLTSKYHITAVNSPAKINMIRNVRPYRRNVFTTYIGSTSKKAKEAAESRGRGGGGV